MHRCPNGPSQGYRLPGCLDVENSGWRETGIKVKHLIMMVRDRNWGRYFYVVLHSGQKNWKKCNLYNTLFVNCTGFFLLNLFKMYVICQLILNFPSHFLKVEFQMSLITSLAFTKGFFRDRKSRVFFTHTCACLDTYGAINFWFHCNMGELYGSKNCWTEK